MISQTGRPILQMPTSPLSVNKRYSAAHALLPAPVLTASHISHHRTAGQKLLLRNPRIATKSSPDSSSTERPRSIEYVETLGEIRQHPRKKVVENTIDIGCATNIEAQRLDHHRSTRGFTHGHYSCKFTPECGRHERRNEE